MPPVLVERVKPPKAAAFLGITCNTLYRYTREKRLACVRIGNRLSYSVDELERFVHENECPREVPQ